jgi:polysaccharide pyruvyl transferase WcaK-like protein
MSKKTIGIFGHYGTENLGDEAIIEACVQRLPEFFDDVELQLFSSRPDDTARRYQLPAHPIRYLPPGTLSSTQQIEREHEKKIDHTGKSQSRSQTDSGLKAILKKIPLLWPLLRAVRNLPTTLSKLTAEIRFLLQARKRLQSLDLLIIAGSNQFLDNFGGPWGFPYTLLKWSWMARTVGVPVAFASVGAGPLDQPLSKRLVRLAVRNARFLSFRDDASRQLVDPKNAFDGKVFPDLAFSIDYPEARVIGQRNAASKPVIAVNAMAVYDARYWYIKDPIRYRNYVSKMTDLTEWLIAKNYEPKLFATQVKDLNVIDDICDELVARGGDRALADSFKHQFQEVNDMLRFLQSADIVVPTRFHGTVLGLWACKPTIGICYYRKAADLLAEFGQGQYAFGIDEFEVADVSNAIESALADYQNITADISRKVDACRDELAAQYASLRSLMTD